MNIAIIGCGLIGEKRLKVLNGNKLTYLCDINIEKANELNKKYQKNAMITDNFMKVVEDKETELVIISTTNNLLANIAEQCIKNNKYVLVEKPAGRNFKELENLKNYEKNIKVGFNLRYHGAIRKAKEIIDSNEIGELIFVRGRYGHGGRLGMEKEWRFNKEISGGGEMLDQGCHMIDLSRYFLGDLKLLNSEIKTYFWNTELEDNGFLALESKTGQISWLHVSCTEWKNTFCLEIYGKQGKLQIDGLNGSYGMEKLTFYKMLPQMGKPETYTYSFSEDTSWQDELNDFINCIENKKQIIDGNINDAYKTLKIIDEVYKK